MLGIFSNMFKTATLQDRWSGPSSSPSHHENLWAHERRKAIELRKQIDSQTRHLF